MWANLLKTSVRTGRIPLFRFYSSKDTVNEDDAPKDPDPCECGCLEKNVSGLAMPLDKVKVAILGGDNESAQVTAFLLKMNNLVSEIRLHGDDEKKILRGASLDLSQIPTQNVITAHAGPNQLTQALCQAEIVLISGSASGTACDAEAFDKNSYYMRLVAAACINTCPEAVFAISVPPVNSSLPLFAEILKQNGVFCASRVIGSAMEPMLAARTLIAGNLGLHPRSVSVKITGGLSPTTLIPVVTSACPGGFFLYKEACALSNSIRGMGPALKAANCGAEPCLFKGYADAMFVDEIARGLCGKSEGRTVAVYMRSILVPELHYMVLPVELGLNGVETVQGIPSMSPSDFDLLESAVPALASDIFTATEYASKFATNLSAQDPRIPDFGCPENPCKRL